MRKSTMVELVDELEKLLADPSISEEHRKGLTMMIAEAKAGEYHDFKNNKYACGKVASSSYLQQMGYMDLARRIQNGEFDEEPDEQDRKEMRENLFSNIPDRKKAEALAKILGL